jgi:hypothetical protein
MVSQIVDQYTTVSSRKADIGLQRAGVAQATVRDEIETSIIRLVSFGAIVIIVLLVLVALVQVLLDRFLGF